MEWQSFTETRPDIMLGKPVFTGTRLTVEHVLRQLSLGTSEAELLAAHPQLTIQHIRAAMLYAAESINLDTTVAL